MKLSYFVFYVEDIEINKAFYEGLGFAFEREKHGNGPVHYATNIGSTVLEIFPALQNTAPTRLRIGLDISGNSYVIKSVERYANSAGLEIKTTEFSGKRVVLKDPGGNSVDLLWSC